MYSSSVVRDACTIILIQHVLQPAHCHLTELIVHEDCITEPCRSEGKTRRRWTQWKKTNGISVCDCLQLSVIFYCSDSNAKKCMRGRISVWKRWSLWERFQSEPGRQVGSLGCPVTSRPYFTSTRKPQRKTWPVSWGQVQAHALSNWENIPHLAIGSHYPNWLPCMTEQLSLYFQN